MTGVANSLEQALDQIDAFRAIHEPSGVTAGAVACLLESVGIDEHARGVIGERLYDDGAGGSPAFLGVIVGLLAARMGADSRPRQEPPTPGDC